MSHKSKSISWDGESGEAASTTAYYIQALRTQHFYDASHIETAGKGTLRTHFTMGVFGEVRADFKTHRVMWWHLYVSMWISYLILAPYRRRAFILSSLDWQSRDTASLEGKTSILYVPLGVLQIPFLSQKERQSGWGR